MRRADARVVRDEPLFGVVYEQHPGVDLVILPPVEVPELGQPLASVQEARELRDAARSAFDAVLIAVGHRAPTARHDSWRYLDSPVGRKFECRASVRDLPPDGAVPLLRSIGNALLTLGWDARAVVAPTPEILASDTVRLFGAQVVVNAVDLWLESESLMVADDTLDELSRDSS